MPSGSLPDDADELVPLTRAHPGGGLISAPPLRFFADNAKTAARSAAALGIAVHSSFPHIVSKFLAPGHVRSGLQVTLSDVTSKRNLATLTPCHMVTVRNPAFLNF